MNWKSFGLCMLGMLLCMSTQAQKIKKDKPPVYACYEDETVVYIPEKARPAEIDSLIQLFALEELRLPFLMQQGKLHDSTTYAGWQLVASDHKAYYKIVKSAVEDEDNFKAWYPSKPGEPLIPWEDRMLISEHAGIHGFDAAHFYPSAVYGVNQLKNDAVKQVAPGVYIFTLHGFENAQEVLISGSFNGWSTGKYPMKRKSGGWEYTQALQAGKHLYKFIVDGKWISDPQNELQESDGYKGFNSVFFAYNKTFVFNALPDARKVFLMGDFNSWREDELGLSKTNEGWKIDLYLSEGTYAYRFKADRKYYLDPSNPIHITDGDGFENSYTSVGDTLFFTLNGFQNATEVYLAGSFNGWNNRELRLSKTAQGWVIPYVLAAGVYEYKYFVDGRWTVDPGAMYQTGEPPYDNSVLIVKPNHVFKLAGFEQAKEVLVSGSFNDWNEISFKMHRTADGWELPYYLTPGKHTYKFIIDGAWQRDPSNRLWEENEYMTGNSVLWITP